MKLLRLLRRWLGREPREWPTREPRGRVHFEGRTTVELLRDMQRKTRMLEDGKPRVEDLMDALQDRIHPSSGRLLTSKPVARKRE